MGWCPFLFPVSALAARHSARLCRPDQAFYRIKLCRRRFPDGGFGRLNLTLVISLSLIGVLIASLVAFFIALRVRRGVSCLRDECFSYSYDSHPKTIDFCSDHGLTVNTTLTMTLTDGVQPRWTEQVGTFNVSGFGLQI